MPRADGQKSLNINLSAEDRRVLQNLANHFSDGNVTKLIRMLINSEAIDEVLRG